MRSRGRALLAAVAGVFLAVAARGQVEEINQVIYEINAPPTVAATHTILSTTHSDTTVSTPNTNDVLTWNGTSWVASASAGGGAPTTAHYLTNQSESGLSAETNMGSLTTGLTLGTVSAGVWTPSTYGGATCTNQFIRVLSATGGATCGSVANADITAATIDLTTKVTGTLPPGNGGTNSAFFGVSGPTTSTKTFTFPDASSTVLTSNAAVTVGQGGTGIGSGTSGGVLAYTGTGTLASSALLAANAPVLGGGAGVVPKTATGILSDGTSQLTLGLAGTNVGHLIFSNASSGTIDISPASGALGSITSTWPAISGAPTIMQGSTPGTEQTGNFNISGVGILSKDGIATTVTTAGIVSNATASSAGTTLQYSPSLEFDSHAWNTTGLADEKDSWIIYNKPATGNPTTHQLHIESSINGGAYSTNRFVMDQTGGLNLGGSLSIGNNANGGFSLPTTQLITWNSASVMASFADGKIKMTNNGASSFTLLALGGTSASHPALKREGNTSLSSRLADDSAYAGMVADNVSLTSANGAIEQGGQVSELLTLSTGGLTTDTTMNIPAGSVVTGVVTRITTAITTTTNYAVGDPTTSDRFCSASSTLTLGSTQICNNFLNPATATTDARGPRQAAAAHVRITCTGSNPGAGAIRITVFYRLYTAPTS